MQTRFLSSSRRQLHFAAKVFGFLLLVIPFAEKIAHCATGTPPFHVAQWTIFETVFTSTAKYGNAFQDVAVKVEFTSPSGKAITVPAFWDTGDTWRVRFSPEETGKWSYRVTASNPEDNGLNHPDGSFTCVPYTGKNPLYVHGAIRVSAKKTYLEQADGTPFLWLSDTSWNGALKADAKSWEMYLNDRAAKKFTAVQFVMTQWIAAAANGDARLAYQGREKIVIDPVFFQWLDDRFKALNDHGMVAAPVLIWDAPWSDFSGALNPGNSLPDDQVTRLIEYMVARYGAFQDVWILAGDGDYRGVEAERWRKIGRAVFGEHSVRPVTIHPTGHRWLADELVKEPWLDILGYQSGHGDGPEDFRWICYGPPATSWKMEPIRPIINLEPNYEGHVSYYSHKPFDAHAVRRAVYWSLLVSPTAGVTYGGHGVWSWETRSAQPMNHLGTGIARPWFEAIHLPGSMDMRNMMNFFLSLPWWTLRPAPSLLEEQPGSKDPSQFVAAAKPEAGDWAVLYMPAGGQVKVRLGELAQANTVRWFNPRSGQWAGSASISRPTASITSPDSNDWVAWIGKK